MPIEYRKTRTEAELKKLAAWHYLIKQGETPREAAQSIADTDFDDSEPEFSGNRSYCYTIASEDEALDIVSNYIQDALWAFNADFLASFCDLPSEVFEAIQANNKCEGNNDTIERLIERSPGGLTDFVDQAISADGIGHFLNSYDGESDEITLAGETYVIWKK